MTPKREPRLTSSDLGCVVPFFIKASITKACGQPVVVVVICFLCAHPVNYLICKDMSVAPHHKQGGKHNLPNAAKAHKMAPLPQCKHLILPACSTEPSFCCWPPSPVSQNAPPRPTARPRTIVNTGKSLHIPGPSCSLFAGFATATGEGLLAVVAFSSVLILRFVTTMSSAVGCQDYPHRPSFAPRVLGQI